MWLLFLLLGLGQARAATWATHKPKLVVVVVIDQFRADYLSRFQSQFGKDGFLAMINQGAYFPNGEYDIMQSMTCPGHSTVLTGAYPYQMGIPINEWFDQKQNKVVACVEDSTVQVLGGKPESEGSSPHNLVGTTLGDELKNAAWPSKVVSLSLKARSAVMLGGHRADLALWYDKPSARWTTSTYYRKDKLPTWVDELNAADRKGCAQEEPCGVDMTVAAFNAALTGEHLGQGPGPDILAVSFSSHDFAGHKYGPNAEQMKVMTLAEDKAIGQLRAALAKKVPGGLKNVVMVLTGDHGVAPTPEYLAGTGIESGKINEKTLVKEMTEFLNKKYGAPKAGMWISHVIDFNFYLNEENVRQAKLDIHLLERDLKDMLQKNPAFAFVFTREDYDARLLPPRMIGRQIMNTYYPTRSGHVVALQKPFFINLTSAEANHMTGYVYDRSVPILFSGFGIKNGLFADKAEVVDIAPTLAFLLGVLPPALSEGKVLSQALTGVSDVTNSLPRTK